MDFKLPDNWPRPAFLVPVGSHAYGLAVEGSDLDYKGFYIAPSTDFWKLSVPNVQYQSTEIEGDRDVTLWEVGKFIHLSLAGNPAVLEVLWGGSPIVESYEAKILREHRDIFLSQRICKTYKGYACSQIGKSKRDLKYGKDLRPKSLMHCLRLLLTGKHLLRTGEVLVNVGELREYLLDVRYGRVSTSESIERCEQLFKEFDAEVANTVLPKEPEREKAEELLIRIRQRQYHGFNEI